MNDSISRQAAIDAIEGITSSMSICVNSDECHGMKRMQRQAVLEIANMPSIQLKRGEWTEKEVSDSKSIEEWQSARCSVCGKYHTTPYMYYFSEYNYCPNCGAEMSEGGEQT